MDIPEDAQGFVFLNISSYGGGVKLWANERTQRSSSSTSLEYSSEDGSEGGGGGRNTPPPITRSTSGHYLSAGGKGSSN